MIGIETADRTRTAIDAAHVRLERLPDAVGRQAPMDVAEMFRDLPGLALLESGRPGRRSRWSYLTADPVATLEVTGPDGRIDERRERGSTASGAGPAWLAFVEARRMLGRLTADPVSFAATEGRTAPPFIGGLVGYLGYDVGLALEPRRTGAIDDQELPIARLALHDWVVAWDRRTGAAWLGGRAADRRGSALETRLARVRERLLDGPARIVPADGAALDGTVFTSTLTRPDFEVRVEAIRSAIATGEIYQANLSRRLETPFAGDPWPFHRRVRTGDPALYAAYLDLGEAPSGARRAIVSASPEPFLAVDPAGIVVADPIKGTRPRGRDRRDDRVLAHELLTSAKDRAENTMIVDVLRNDLGRVCSPGSVRVPRLCRLERTAAVQHLVSTVTGRLAPGRDVFDLLAAAFPGGSITGAPKIRAMAILEGLETIRRGPYTGALGWIGPDGAMATSILIRTFVADGRRLSLNVGGGITWRSDPAAEWEETVAKARGPLEAIGGREADR